MFRRKFENLLKMNTEFGGAEPPTEATEPDESTEATREPESWIENVEGGAEPPEEEPQEDDPDTGGDGTEQGFDQTEAVTRRINKIRHEADRKVREAEQRAREALERQELNREHSDFLQAQGCINPYTGRTIDSIGEYRRYKQTYDEEIAQSQPVDMERLVEEKVSAVLRQQTARQEITQHLRSDLAKISKMNPAIKGVDDIGNLPEAQEILGKVSNGYSVYDAYVTSVKVRASKTKEDTTGHLVSLKGNTGSVGLRAIPAEHAAFYENAWPDLTLKERTEKYNRILKLQGE